MKDITTTATVPPHHLIIDQATHLQPSTAQKYKRAIDYLIQAGVNPQDPRQLKAYAAGLSSSGRFFLKAALALLFKDVKTQLQAGANENNLAKTQAALLNIEAMSESIHTEKTRGEKAHTWLTQDQVNQILSIPNTQTTKGMRDYIVLATLLGAGLRREELAGLTFESMKRLPLPQGQGFRDVLEVKGKGAKTRIVPISSLLAQRLLEWKAIAGPGNIARALTKGAKVRPSLSVIGIFAIVREYGAFIGLPALDPHDCRRTFGRLGYEATKDINQVCRLLGHADVKTTMIYIGVNQDLDNTVSDHIIREFVPSIGD